MYVTSFAIISWLVTMTVGHTGIRPGQVTDTITATKLFTKSDANKILGSPSHLADSSVKRNASVHSYLCGYKADKEDRKTGKTGAVYFLFEAYNDIDSASKRYSDVYISNRVNGMEKVTLSGDEALHHTDHQNFDLMMLRKGRYVVTIKVNKLTSTTSLKDLENTLKRIAEQL